MLAFFCYFSLITSLLNKYGHDKKRDFFLSFLVFRTPKQEVIVCLLKVVLTLLYYHTSYNCLDSCGYHHASQFKSYRVITPLSISVHLEFFNNFVLHSIKLTFPFNRVRVNILLFKWTCIFYPIIKYFYILLFIRYTLNQFLLIQETVGHVLSLKYDRFLNFFLRKVSLYSFHNYWLVQCSCFLRLCFKSERACWVQLLVPDKNIHLPILSLQICNSTPKILSNAFKAHWRSCYM